MPINLPREVQFELRRKANKAIWEGVKAGYPAGLPRGEVACLKNLVEEGIPRVDRAWQPILNARGVNATLSGVVCHGRPVVRFGGNLRGCELGDFLLVHDHQPQIGQIERRAVLVQAKVYYQLGGVRSTNRLQLDLYSRWPVFTYIDWPGGINRLTDLLNRHALLNAARNPFDRNIAFTGAVVNPLIDAQTLEASGRYGLIDVDYHRFYMNNWHRDPWRLASPNAWPTVYRTRSGFKIGTYLSRLIRGDAGRAAPVIGWPADFDAACQWSLVVRELMSLMPAAAASGIPPVAQPLGAAPAPIFSPRTTEEGRKIPAKGGSDPPRFEDGEEPERGSFAVIFLKTSQSSPEPIIRRE